MIRIIGPSGSGKTTELIKQAAKHGYVIVEPNYTQANTAIHMARELGLQNVTILPMYTWLRFRSHSSGSEPVLFDELDECLEAMNVVGFSNREENEHEPRQGD